MTITATATASANMFISIPNIQQGTQLLNKPFVRFKKVSSSFSSVILEDDEEKQQLNEPEPLISSSRGCKACGIEEPERGCNLEGRIQGGIATVPGFGWWPIKAYRPCPAFVASGGRYRRRGQSMDEVASGESKKPKKVVSKEINDEAQSR